MHCRLACRIACETTLQQAVHIVLVIMCRRRCSARLRKLWLRRACHRRPV